MDDLTVDMLRSYLEKIEEASPGTAAKAPRSQLKKTIAFLSEHSGKTLSELVVALEALKPPVKVPKARQRSATAKPKAPRPPVQMQLVEHRVSRLRAAESSLDEFAAVLAALKADRQVRPEEIKEIVAAYSGDTSSIKTKALGLAVLQRTFDGRWNLRQHKEGLA